MDQYIQGGYRTLVEVVQRGEAVSHGEYERGVRFKKEEKRVKNKPEKGETESCGR